MNGFWMIVTALMTSVIVAMLPVLLRTRPILRQTTSNRTLHDLRIAELRRDVDEQSIDTSELAEAENEIARALLEESDLDSDTGDAKNTAAGRWFVAIIVLIAIPTISLLTYISLGSPQLATGVARIDPGVDQKTISAMITQLEQRLANDPESAEGWLLLGRTYMALRRFDEAVTALARAHELTGDVPRVLIQYADALSMAGGGLIDARVLALVNRALELEPENISALWLAGIGAAEAGETEKALAYLRQAKLFGSQKGNPIPEIDSAIHELEARLVPSAQNPATRLAAVTMTVMVNIDPDLRSQVDSRDILFVFARAYGQDGPPLAVSKTRVDNLPREIVLDDTMAMAPMFKLKIGDTITVTARVSKSGTPQPQSGDLQAVSEPLVVGKQNAVTLLVDKVVK